MWMNTSNKENHILKQTRQKTIFVNRWINGNKEDKPVKKVGNRHKDKRENQWKTANREMISETDTNRI
jgi:hypothetical protein